MTYRDGLRGPDALVRVTSVHEASFLDHTLTLLPLVLVLHISLRLLRLELLSLHRCRLLHWHAGLVDVASILWRARRNHGNVVTRYETFSHVLVSGQQPPCKAPPTSAAE